MTRTKSKVAQPHDNDGTTAPERRTKLALMREMLERPAGAVLDELCSATGWQKHSVRAALSGLRKSGFTVERHAADGNESGPVYRIILTDGTVQ